MLIYNINEIKSNSKYENDQNGIEVRMINVSVLSTKSDGGTIKLLNGISGVISRGKMCAIMGASGAGIQLFNEICSL